MEEAEESETDFPFLRKHLTSFLYLVFWIIVLLTIQYLARDSDYSNVEIPKDSDKYIFWPLIIILFYLSVFKDTSGSQGSSDSDDSSENISTRNVRDYLVAGVIFVSVYLVIGIYNRSRPNSDYSDLSPFSEDNLYNVMSSLIITLMIRIMLYQWHYSSDDD
jgi:hypothetical protein